MEDWFYTQTRQMIIAQNFPFEEKKKKQQELLIKSFSEVHSIWLTSY